MQETTMSKKESVEACKSLRTRDEIDAEYTNHATQAGHKTNQCAQLEKQIEEHYTQMDKLWVEPAAPKAEEPKGQ